jgi:hypothetical protein
MVAHVHRRVDGQKEEPNPQLVCAVQQLRIGPHKKRKGLAMAELIVAPLLEPQKDRMEALVWVALQVAVDCDVPRVANLLRQVSGVENKLWLEEGVLLRLGQEAEIDANAKVLKGVIDEACVARLVTRHELEELA